MEAETKQIVEKKVYEDGKKEYASLWASYTDFLLLYFDLHFI